MTSTRAWRTVIYQHLLDHASVKTTETAYAAIAKNQRLKQTISLLDQQVQPRMRVVKCGKMNG